MDQQQKPSFTPQTMGSMPFTGFGPTPSSVGGQPGGGGGGGSTDVLASFKTGGFGNMPASASKGSQALRGAGSSMNWQDLRYGGGTRRGEEMGTMSDQANIRAQMTQEGREGEEWDEKMRMIRMKSTLMQKLMSLFGGQGTGGNLNVGMPVQPDPNIMASLKAGVQEQFDPMEKAEAKMRAGTGRTAFDSTAAAQRGAALAGRKASAMSQTYMPGQQATVAGYQPGLEAARINKQGQITPQLILQAMMGQGGMA